MATHSSLVGGSIADRRINCPASFKEQLRSPPGVTSVYADKGTAMHEAMTHWLRNPDDDLLGKTFYDFVITVDDIDALLEPAWNALCELQEVYGGGFKVTHQEKQVQFPKIPGAFGTVDVILQSRTHFIVADFKFGAGVYVPCVYEDGKPNSQLMFYLGGAAYMADGREMVIAIVQPTFEPHLSHTTVCNEHLADYVETLNQAVTLALSHDPPRARGEWCRFAPCKATCHLFTGPLLDLTALGRPSPPQVDRHREEYGIYLALAKRLVDNALIYQKEIDAALMEHLLNGGTAPGFAVKHKEKNRKWLDDAAAVAKQLKKLGLKEDEIWQHKLQTFQVVDRAAKKRGVTIPDALRPKPPSTDLTLTYQGDPQAVDVGKLSVEFSTALKQLSQTT